MRRHHGIACHLFDAQRTPSISSPAPFTCRPPAPARRSLPVIKHDTTSDAAMAAAFDVGLRQGKTVIAVADVPGFYVNRCLGPCAQPDSNSIS
jgi:hypothetical protein